MKFLFADDCAVYVGKVTNSKFVTHQGASVIFALDGTFDLDFGSRYLRRLNVAFVPSLIKHRFDGNSNNHVFLMIDPDHQLAIRLNQQFNRGSDATLTLFMQQLAGAFTDKPNTDLQEQVENARVQLAALHGGCKHGALDTRITQVVEHIKAHLENRIRAAELSRVAALSDSRLAHLFRAQIGMPIRKYILWQRMKHALSAAQNGMSLTDAALHGGFADASHFSRTVSRMFAASPSEILHTLKK